MSVTADFAEREENIRMIRESAANIVAPERLRRIRALRHSLPGIAPEDWSSMAELGWLGLRTPERLGGASMGMAEFCALAEELGRGLIPEAALHVTAIAPLLPDDERTHVISGKQIVLPAWQEALGDPDKLSTRFAGGRAHGSKRFVPYAESASAFLITTSQGLILVARDANGLSLTTEKRQDGGHWGTLTLEGVAAREINGTPDGVREEIVLALAAYLLGVMERAFDITREYLKTRRQFDQPIGSFQALQHRMVDLYFQIELTRASVGQAAALFDRGEEPLQQQRAASRAKARASDAAMLVTRSAVQLHGAIGYTDDHDIGLFLRKAMVLSNAFGSASYHRRRFSRLSGFIPGDTVS